MQQESIARIFYLVFSQACVGGFLLLPLTPRKGVPIGFFRVMGAIFLTTILLGAWAHWLAQPRFVTDAWRTNMWRQRETWLLWTFVGALALYTAAVFIDRSAHQRTAWIMGAVAGTGVVLASALSDSASQRGAWPVGSMVLNFSLATLLLGSVTNGMLFGHWFLVDPHMSLDPLKKLIMVLGGSLVGAIFLLIVNAFTLDTSLLLGEERLFHTMLFWMRMLFGTVSSLLLAILTWRCLILGPGITKYHATRAATGLLYVAMLTTFAGELLGRFLLITTNVPV